MLQHQSFYLRSMKIAAGSAIAAGFLLMATSAYAATPSLSLSSVSGNSVQVSVNGDANSNVMFYYNVASASGMQVTTLGATNASGYFTETISASTYGIISGDNTYVIVNGQQSPMQAWPSPTGTPTLGQSSVTLGLGQSVTVYETGSSAPVYSSNNTNPSIASVQTNGTQVTVVGNQTGSTVATICYTGTSSNCTSLPIIVQTASVISFNQNNLTLAVGQGSSVTVSGGSGNYSITSNSNPSDVSAILSGNTITLSGLVIGSANVTVCDTSGNCGTLYITTSGTSSSGSLYFSTTNPTITVGQVTTVTISGGSGFYVTGNSNSSVASQSINGSTLTISGLTAGSTTFTVCSAANGCGTLYVTVSGTSSSGGNVIFGVTNPTVTIGQNMGVSLSGASTYYISATANSNILQGSVSGGTLTIYGESVGSGSLTVCATGGSCNTFYATVVAAGQTASTVSTAEGASQSALLTAIQSVQSQLASLVTQIQSMATALTQAAASVAANSGTTATTGIATNTGTTASTSSGTYNFTEFLSIGSADAQVEQLQQYLTAKNFFTGTITGYYGTVTESAVAAYQKAHGIDPAGYVGPSTRAAMNAGE